MIRKRFLGSFSAAAVVAAFGVMAGCAGTSSAPVEPLIPIAGGLPAQTNGTTAAAIPAPGAGGTNTNIVVNGVATPVVIPNGAGAAPAGSNLGVLPLGSQPLTGAFTDNDPVGFNGAANSGVSVNAAGAIKNAVALPVDGGAAGTSYTIDLPTGNLVGKGLTIKKVTFKGAFYVNFGPPVSIVSPIPTNITGSLPNNGQNAAGSAVTCTWGAGNNGRTATLTVVYGNGFVLNKTKTILGGTATFNDFNVDASNVPNGGVNEVKFEIGPR